VFAGLIRFCGVPSFNVESWIKNELFFVGLKMKSKCDRVRGFKVRLFGWIRKYLRLLKLSHLIEGNFIENRVKRVGYFRHSFWSIRDAVYAD
jgi:hypothetical protein